MSAPTVPKTVSLSTLKSLNGIFAVYKKQGPTSADVLNSLKEALLKEAGVKNPNPRKRRKQELKMGHGGTLDSAASGVLVVGVGSGTKMLSTMLAGSKKYLAVGELGKATDTLDATGNLTHEKEFGHITRMDFEEKLKMYTGEIMQVPPLYSALKKDGKRLSVLLKQGHEVQAKPARPVTVYNLTLQEFSPPLFTLDIECGGGFYVRSLVDDLGKALSSCAHVKELIRTKQGQFTLEDHALQETHWTLEHVTLSLLPCAGSRQNTTGLQPCAGSEQNTPTGLQPCAGSEQNTTGLQPCPGSEQNTTGLQPCTGSEQNTTGLQPCTGSEQNTPTGLQPCPGSEQNTTGLQPCTGSEQNTPTGLQPCAGSKQNTTPTGPDVV